MAAFELEINQGMMITRTMSDEKTKGSHARHDSRSSHPYASSTCT